jgi:hypothetical protein
VSIPTNNSIVAQGNIVQIIVFVLRYHAIGNCSEIAKDFLVSAVVFLSAFPHQWAASMKKYSIIVSKLCWGR